MKKRYQIIPRNGIEYKMLKNVPGNKFKQTKEEWLSEKCADRNTTKH